MRRWQNKAPGIRPVIIRVDAAGNTRTIAVIPGRKEGESPGRRRSGQKLGPLLVVHSASGTPSVKPRCATTNVMSDSRTKGVVS